MPTVTNVDGIGHLTAGSLKLDIAKGALNGIELSKGLFRIPDFHADDGVIEIAFLGKGPIRSVLEMLDKQPLGLARESGIRSAEVGGSLRTEVRFRLPLQSSIGVNDIVFEARAHLKNLETPPMVGDHEISNGNLELNVTPTAMVASGQLNLDDVPMQVTLRHELKVENERAVVDAVTLQADLNEEHRARLGFVLGGFVKGPVMLRADVRRRANGQIEASGELDLRRAALEIPQLFWSKPADVDGTLAFEMSTNRDKPIWLRKVHLAAADMDAEGEIFLDANRNFRRLTARRLKFGVNDITARLARLPTGSVKLEIEGRQFDFSIFLDEFKAGPNIDASIDRLDFKARVDRAIVSGTTVVTQSVIDAKWRDGRLDSMVAGGRVQGGPRLRVVLARGEGKTKRKLTISAEDGGAVMRAMDLFHNAVGGKLHLTAEIPDEIDDDQPIKGRIRGDNFHLIKVETLGRILSSAELTEAVNSLSGEGIRFARLDVLFSLTSKQLVISKARAFGPSLGITVSGDVDREKRLLNLKGTLVPAYTLNSALGKIPIIGPFLIGGEGGGLFALSYSVTGTVEEPDVSVNPLSILAPGFLRRIIAGLDQPAVADEDFPGDENAN